MFSDDQVNAGLFGLVVVRGDLDEVPGVAGLPERVLVTSQIDVVDDAIVPSGDAPVTSS